MNYIIAMIGAALVVMAGIFMQIACYGKPHTVSIALQHAPGWTWVLLVVGLGCFLYGYCKGNNE